MELRVINKEDVAGRYTYAEMATRVDQLAHMLQRTLGIQAGDVVGTMAWNTYRHMEAWCAPSSN